MQRSTTPSSFLNLSIFSPPPTASSAPRPVTRDGAEVSSPRLPHHHHHQHHHHYHLPHGLVRKASLSAFTSRRRRSSLSSPASPSAAFFTDAAAPPALPDYALPAAAKVQRSRSSVPSQDGGGTASVTAPGRSSAVNMPPPGPIAVNGSVSGSSVSGSSALAVTAAPATTSSIWQPSEASVIHQQIAELATKRISTLDYLRKAHEGRVYWFNTYLFDRPDLARMPYFDPRKLARRATNFLLLGLSVPTINDLYSSSAIEFLRCLNALLSEFDSFQQLHGDSSATLTRARLPNMFRRQGGKARRSSSATEVAEESQAMPALPGGAVAGAPSVMTFAASESDLLPGEEYTYLLTPSLPFEPDFFETFATLCDVLIDCYRRFLALVPTPRECSAPVAELFSKVDSKLRKIIVQGPVKEFEDYSRSQVKAEVASIGKVVLGGLM
ncbi:hypothetical protein XA68_12631 [Ophiocordyceps unilateralis]|uniref:Uncharacterized protein n=1 Tax=Ophiocordyceps unilateralis TaxID=268505 RepID=A0A2A9PE93_OPHUN|nr:hypothetical protein XA68_12631 [Ophiocordyceps unilateralis]